MTGLKVAASVFAAFLVPVYWRTYGPANFLWISDIALFLTLAALWLENPLLLSTAAVAALPFELAWNVEYFTRLVTGKRLFGITEYMFCSNLKRYVRGLSLFHVALPPLWIALLATWGYDARALAAAAILFAALVPLTAALTEPAENVNWVFLPRKRKWPVPLPLWIAAYIILTPVLIFWPVHAALRALF